MISTPRRVMPSISWSRIFRGRRCSGIPTLSMPPRLRQGFENGRPDALPGQVVGRGQPRRSGTDDGHRLGPGREAFDADLPQVAAVGGEPLEIPDRNRFIFFTSAAGVLASVRADPSQHSGQGQVLHDDLKGLFVLSLLHHLHIALHIQTGRAGEPARSLVRFLNRKSTGNGLGVLLVDGLPVASP